MWRLGYAGDLSGGMKTVGKQSDKRGLTRIEALVVVAACALLVMLVPVLLAVPRTQARRILCEANLARIGKAMVIYANDHGGVLPRAGGPSSVWGPPPNGLAADRYLAFGMPPSTGEGGAASISACFYLLVKYLDMPTRLFICPGDIRTREFKLSELPIVDSALMLADIWDFGPFAEHHCSFSYHLPYRGFALTTARDPNLAVAADRNPWLRTYGAEPQLLSQFKPDIEPWQGSAEEACRGNAMTHERDGQNVLFLDGRVAFERRSFCGVGRDNIYTISARGPEGGDPFGMTPPALARPQNEYDSLLVHDPPGFVFGAWPKKP
jgi:hypothetical protein